MNCLMQISLNKSHLVLQHNISVLLLNTVIFS